MKDVKQEKLYFAIWVRVFSAISILMCHYVIQSKNIYLNMLSQFFNIGVQLFFILSGFLFGWQKQEREWRKWFKKRIKRIGIPYEIFVLFLYIVFRIVDREVVARNWILLVLGMQGTDVKVLGAEHTWFITALLICYAMTPIVSLLVSKLVNNKCWMIIAGVGIIPMLLSIILEANVLVLIQPVVWYFFAFLLGYCWEKIKLGKKYAVFAGFIMSFAFIIRILGRIMLDETLLYERIVVNYTQWIAAFCIFYILAVACQGLIPSRCIQHINDISFEIYLCHYMLCVGPIRLFGKISNWMLECIVITIISFGLGSILNIIAKAIRRKL